MEAANVEHRRARLLLEGECHSDILSAVRLAIQLLEKGSRRAADCTAVEPVDSPDDLVMHIH